MSEKINHTELILERMKHEAEMAKLQNENEKLKQRHNEAVELLIKAVEDIHDILTSQKRITNNTLCEKCKHYIDCYCKEICVTRSDLKQWRHTDEAIKLIGDEESGIEHLKHLACNVAFLCELERGESK